MTAEGALVAFRREWMAAGGSSFGDRAIAAGLRAALPAIEAGLREDIARQLETAADEIATDAVRMRTAAVMWIAAGVRQAVRIVRDGDQ